MSEIISLEDLISKRKKARDDGDTVVFTNGCFDILHRGHVEYLQSAKMLGDILIIGLNSDRSVQLLKGKNRPIILQEDRAFILIGLQAVDYVCIFDEETPEKIIAAVLPDVLVKGGDYEIGDILGKETVMEAGGEVLTIDLIEGKATKVIIDIIVNRFCSGIIK